jgi:hypothetical protein
MIDASSIAFIIKPIHPITRPVSKQNKLRLFFHEFSARLASVNNQPVAGGGCLGRRLLVGESWRRITDVPFKLNDLTSTMNQSKFPRLHKQNKPAVSSLQQHVNDCSGFSH